MDNLSDGFRQRLGYFSDPDTPMEKVCDLPSGYVLYVAKSKHHGGDLYWSDEVPCGVLVWDTAIADVCTLEAALEHHRKLAEERSKGES